MLNGHLLGAVFCETHWPTPGLGSQKGGAQRDPKTGLPGSKIRCGEVDFGL